VTTVTAKLPSKLEKFIIVSAKPQLKIENDGSYTVVLPADGDSTLVTLKFSRPFSTQPDDVASMKVSRTAGYAETAFGSDSIVLDVRRSDLWAAYPSDNEVTLTGFKSDDGVELNGGTPLVIKVKRKDPGAFTYIGVGTIQANPIKLENNKSPIVLNFSDPIASSNDFVQALNMVPYQPFTVTLLNEDKTLELRPVDTTLLWTISPIVFTFNRDYLLTKDGGKLPVTTNPTKVWVQVGEQGSENTLLGKAVGEFYLDTTISGYSAVTKAGHATTGDSKTIKVIWTPVEGVKTGITDEAGYEVFVYKAGKQVDNLDPAPSADQYFDFPASSFGTTWDSLEIAKAASNTSLEYESPVTRYRGTITLTNNIGLENYTLVIRPYLGTAGVDKLVGNSTVLKDVFARPVVSAVKFGGVTAAKDEEGKYYQIEKTNADLTAILADLNTAGAGSSSYTIEVDLEAGSDSVTSWIPTLSLTENINGKTGLGISVAPGVPSLGGGSTVVLVITKTSAFASLSLTNTQAIRITVNIRGTNKNGKDLVSVFDDGGNKSVSSTTTLRLNVGSP
jgi:hypothetical protein